LIKNQGLLWKYFVIFVIWMFLLFFYIIVVWENVFWFFYYYGVRKCFLVFLLLCLTRVSSCSYVSPGSMEKSKLRSSGARKCFCFDWFYLWKWFGRTWRKVCLKKKRADSYLNDGDPFEKKLNTHGVKKRFAKKGDGLAFERWWSVWEKIKRAWRENKFA